MSSLLYDGINNLPRNEETDGPISDTELLQCVNPQYTDKRYHCPQGSKTPGASDGFMTPCPSRIDLASRRTSLRLSDTGASCSAGPASASSTSSFDSSPGYPSSCSSSVSTAASSRRQSEIYPDNNQYYLSDASPTPAFRPGRSKEPFGVDHYSLQEPFFNDLQGFCTNTTSLNVTGNIATTDGEHEFLVPVFDYAERAQNEWSDHENSLHCLPTSELPGQSISSTYLSADLVANFNGSSIVQIDDYARPDFESPQSKSFGEIPEHQGIVPSQIISTHSPRTLGEALHFHQRQFNDETSTSDDDEYPTGTILRNVDAVSPCSRKGKPPRKPGNRHKDPLDYTKFSKRSNQCKKCTYACGRSEHLTRHENSKHAIDPKEYPCVFPDCIDKKSGKRRSIIARNDNFKTHFTKTHFSYGNTENSGKNRRKSMKVSIENGLRDNDSRWTIMLAGEMTMDQHINSFLNVWKMIGYSIKETRELKVKDIAPEWQGRDETTLEKFDPRWRALKERTMSYEQAMSVGSHMAETPKQGLLGVTMAETEEMGIKDLDVRWQVLESERMSVEDSEKLGVKDRNPAWHVLQARRRR